MNTEQAEVKDPAGARWDMYAVAPPEGDWAYILDDYGIKYRRGLVAQRLRPGWWPFAYDDPKREHQARRDRRSGPVKQECGAAHICLSPDTAFYAWRNETVSVFPDFEAPHLAAARLTLYVRRGSVEYGTAGGGGMVIVCHALFNLAKQEVTVTGMGDDWPHSLREQAEHKAAAKVLDYLIAAIKERDTDRERPETAHERYMASKGGSK